MSNILFFTRSTPLHHQREIMREMCESVGGQMTNKEHYIECDIAVVFGSWKKIPKKKWKLMLTHHFLKNDIVEKHRGKLIVIETPLLGRTITDTHQYYRVGLDHFMRGLADFKNKNMPSNRFDAMNIKIKPWRKWTPDGHVLIVGQNLYDASLFSIDFQIWVYNTIKHLMKHTKRKIIVRDHPENKDLLKEYIFDKFKNYPQVQYNNPLNKAISVDLKGAHCVISYTSGSSIDAILAGVPVITCSEYNFLWPISTHTLEDVENPRTGDREQLLYDLAYAQWTVQEIKNGDAWRHLI